ncbi:MAG: hypothetical protein E6I54_13075 [Chloroflexi bacterium]|nr:MAG: hypothetical protein E6I54_13075 [Chloroflexota bacterium]
MDRAQLDGRSHRVLAPRDHRRHHRLRSQSPAEQGPRIRPLRDHASRSRVQPATGTAAAPVTHPSSALDDTIHQRVRLGILAVLSESRRADFAYLKDVLEVTAGNLSQPGAGGARLRGRHDARSAGRARERSAPLS